MKFEKGHDSFNPACIQLCPIIDKDRAAAAQYNNPIALEDLRRHLDDSRSCPGANSAAVCVRYNVELDF